MKVIKICEPVIGDEEINEVIRVLKSKYLVYGPVVKLFEEMFAKYIGVKHALTVCNGTVALDLILKALNIGPGDEVIVPDFTFIATANVVLFQGARPVFADIDLETYTIDPNDVLEKITNKTKAIIAVHLYGHPADMKALMEIAEDHKLYLIEDAAQAHGAEYEGKRVGGFGIAGAFSFYATKNMTMGEGGAITTNSDDLAYKISMLRDHGQERKYYHVTLGGNYRITAMQAALGIAQLKKLDALNEIRAQNAETLTKIISKISGLRPPKVKDNVKHVWHQYVIWVEENFPLNRDQLSRKLREYGVETAVHYPLPIHLQPLYKALGYSPNICPNSIEASKHVLSLPIHPLLKPSDIEYIGEVLRRIADGI